MDSEPVVVSGPFQKAKPHANTSCHSLALMLQHRLKYSPKHNAAAIATELTLMKVTTSYRQH